MRQKAISILALLLMAATGATAQSTPQVPNGDFETWTYDGENLPNNWNSYSTGEGSLLPFFKGKGGVTRSTDVRPGSADQYSCDIYSGSNMGQVVVGILTSGRIVCGSMSAGNSANYNYSDRDGSNTKNEVVNPCAMRFTGKPKAVKVWVKFTQGTTQTTYKYAKFSAIIHSDADYKAHNVASNDNNANKALVVASAVKDDVESNGGEWQELTIPFVYTENAVEPAYILINAYTNSTPGKGSNGDHLYIDDIEMVYDAAPEETTTKYNVTLAEGTDDADNWTISPSPAEEGQDITITYSGTKKVKSVKAVKKAAPATSLIVNPAVGQFICSDGKNRSMDEIDDNGLPDGVYIAARIFYVGSDNGEAAPYNHGLALSVEDADYGMFFAWAPNSDTQEHTYKPENSSFTSESGLQYNATYNTDAYPAFKAAISNNGTPAPTGCSDWFLPSGFQWKKMVDAAGGIDNLALTNREDYWSSSEYSASKAWYVDQYGDWTNDSKANAYLVRSCLAF